MKIIMKSLEKDQCRMTLALVFGLLMCILGLLVPAIQATSATVEALSTEELRELQQKMNQRRELSVKFMQVRTSNLRPNKPSKSFGKAIFAKPAKFRWEVEKPAADVLIFDGSSLLSYKPGEKTATRFKTEAERAREIKEVIDFVLDFDALMSRYNLIESSRQNQGISLRLKPKKTSPLSEISIEIDSKSYFVRLVKMIFQNNNTSEFQFSDPQAAQISPQSFAVPEGLKIVDGV